MAERPTTLYRFFDSDGVLLYVGITSRGPARLAEHAADKPWWPDVASTKFEHYPTHNDAALAERRAIRSERPLHNNRCAGQLRASPTSLDDALAAELVAAGNDVRESSDRRDALVLRARAAGASYREIARLVGLTHVGVQKVIERMTRDSSVQTG